MFSTPVEDRFANNISAAEQASKGLSFWPLIILANVGLLAFIVWAANAQIEEVTKGAGKVIPSSQIKVVQTLEAGIVRSILVTEGDVVEAGQDLMQIDDTGFSSKLGELQTNRESLQAERIRLLAEANGASTLEFPQELKQNFPNIVDAETQLFQSRRSQLDNEVAALKSKLSQRQSELAELQARKQKIDSTLKPLRKEAALTKKLFQRGVVPEIEYLRLQSRVADMEGEGEIVLAALPRVEASIGEVNNLISSAKSTYVLSARERLAKIESEIGVVSQTIRGASDRVNRTLLKAPVRGIVNKVNVTTVGAVLQPGADIFEIVPLDGGLLIEAQIRPQDVAFIKPGETATVKLTAYDYLIYGGLVGKVIRISADTITNGDGKQFYRVIVRTDKSYLGNDDTKNPIIPGMVATVDIQTGKNTVLSYLLKPILRARAEAFRER